MLYTVLRNILQYLIQERPKRKTTQFGLRRNIFNISTLKYSETVKYHIYIFQIKAFYEHRRFLLRSNHRIRPSLAVNDRQLRSVFGSGVCWTTSRVSGITEPPISISTINRNINSKQCFLSAFLEIHILLANSVSLTPRDLI